MNWCADWDQNTVLMVVGLGSAFIGAATNLSLSIMRDLSAKRQEKRQAFQVYRSYADPIALAASELFWRLYEILITKRNEYLTVNQHTIEFYNYKYNSTLYRLAALLAWLRAYRRELIHFSLSDPKKLVALQGAIDRFEAALADGMHVEIRRIKDVLNAWDIVEPYDKKTLEKCARDLDRGLKIMLEKHKVQNVEELLEDAHANACQDIYLLVSRIVSEYVPANKGQHPEQQTKQHIDKTIRALAIKEKWLYRDYQAGIGDLLLRVVSGGARHFEIIGYREFEQLLEPKDDNASRWISRLTAIFDELDITAGHSDARVQLLQDVLAATANLLLILSSVDPRRQIVNAKTMCAAEKLLHEESLVKETRDANLRISRYGRFKRRTKTP